MPIEAEVVRLGILRYVGGVDGRMGLMALEDVWRLWRAVGTLSWCGVSRRCL